MTILWTPISAVASFLEEEVPLPPPIPSASQEGPLWLVSSSYPFLYGLDASTVLTTVLLVLIGLTVVASNMIAARSLASSTIPQKDESTTKNATTQSQKEYSPSSSRRSRKRHRSRPDAARRRRRRRTIRNKFDGLPAVLRKNRYEIAAAKTKTRNDFPKSIVVNDEEEDNKLELPVGLLPAEDTSGTSESDDRSISTLASF